MMRAIWTQYFQAVFSFTRSYICFTFRGGSGEFERVFFTSAGWMGQFRVFKDGMIGSYGNDGAYGLMDKEK